MNNKDKLVGIKDKLVEIFRIIVDSESSPIIDTDGSKNWYKNGKRHRDNDLPAIIEADGSKHWYKNGKLHRDGGKPAIIWCDGSKDWWENGEMIKVKWNLDD